MKAFDAKTVQLHGSNLIEASAGTGKTWSVAILVLRLILEKNIPVEKILMVTFTRAAVAELELRIRRFVRLAYRYAALGQPCDRVIMDVVDNSTKEQALVLLKKAAGSLDNLSVMTIHSFCQQMIQNNPFETDQSFTNELMTDPQALVEFFVNDYWRREINTINDLEVFAHLTQYINRQDICQVISKVLGEREYVCNVDETDDMLQQIKAGIAQAEAARVNFITHIENNWDEITSRSCNHYGRGLLEKNPAPQLFADAILDKALNPPGYFDKYFPVELNLALQLCDRRQQLDQLTNGFVYCRYFEIVDQLKKKITDNKYRKNIITYDDLISTMHSAVLRGSINQVVLQQYDAVFIDEFQDTDRKQYELFSGIFDDAAGKIVFYIGDPKQSIYGWRKADIATYKKARSKVGHLHEMNANFRSTGDLITALNDFFSIDDPFHDPDIGYHKVEQGNISPGRLTENGRDVLPLSITRHSKNDHIYEYVKDEVARLLFSPNIQIDHQPVKPSHIAVVTRTNDQAVKMKRCLSDAGIPSIVISDSSVMASDEADSIRTLMEAVVQPGRQLINKLLLNPAFGFSRSDIEQLNEEEHLAIFRSLKEEWKTNGIYNMLFSFFNIYALRKHCLASITGQRSLSNFLQIAEILHRRVLKTRCTPDELIVWLQREKDARSEEYEQRIESEDDAVQITTIHKSKGLTYGIVFAPFADLQVKENVSLFDFRDHEGYKFTHLPTGEQERLWREQAEQENRRLLYVALTRARYKVYLCENTRCKESSLKPFLHTHSPMFEMDVRHDVHIPASPPRDGGSGFVPRTPILAADAVKNTFHIHSFSSLSGAHHSLPFDPVPQPGADAYDRFIFHELGRGAAVGTALHAIFEQLQFDDESTWTQTLSDAARYYPTIIRSEQLQYFHALVRHVMHAEIRVGDQAFTLSQVPEHKKLPELQFFYSVSGSGNQIVAQLIHDASPADARQQGLMTGFVDLLFEHQGKYYILDWKSNHLGNTLQHYSPEALNQAMEASHYTLQYRIYTHAVTQWLQQRIAGFDADKHFGGVVYLFLRGVREGRSTAVFSV